MKKLIVEVSNKGQITLPKTVREMLNIEYKDELELEVSLKHNTITLKQLSLISNENSIRILKDLLSLYSFIIFKSSPDINISSFIKEEILSNMDKETIVSAKSIFNDYGVVNTTFNSFNFHRKIKTAIMDIHENVIPTVAKGVEWQQEEGTNKQVLFNTETLTEEDYEIFRKNEKPFIVVSFTPTIIGNPIIQEIIKYQWDSELEKFVETHYLTH